jgi:FlaG/FlaF family flagellin (archaellin)
MIFVAEAFSGVPIARIAAGRPRGNKDDWIPLSRPAGQAKAMKRPGDAGVSEALGTILMVAVVVALAAAVYVFVSHGSGQQAPPPALALSGDGGATSTDRSFTVSAVSTPIHWSDVAVHLDGVALAYDAALASPRTFCVVTSGSACVPTGSWAPGATFVAAGSRILIHDASLPGETLLVTAPDSNAAILRVNLG